MARKRNNQNENRKEINDENHQNNDDNQGSDEDENPIPYFRNNCTPMRAPYFPPMLNEMIPDKNNYVDNIDMQIGKQF